MEVSGIAAGILAGGKNARMSGRNKAFIKINGEPVIQRALAILKKNFTEIILVTNSPEDFKSYEKEIIITGDLIKGAGPLGGIHAGLSRASAVAVFFIACDMPFLHNAIMRRQAADFNRRPCDCLVSRIGPSIEPLHGIYKKNLTDSIAAFLKKNNSRSIRSFLASVNTRYFDLPDTKINQEFFKNLNTPQDLKNIGASI